MFKIVYKTPFLTARNMNTAENLQTSISMAAASTIACNMFVLHYSLFGYSPIIFRSESKSDSEGTHLQYRTLLSTVPGTAVPLLWAALLYLRHISGVAKMRMFWKRILQSHVLVL